MSQETSAAHASDGSTPNRTVLTAVAWAWVGIPFLYGVYSLVLKIPALF